MAKLRVCVAPRFIAWDLQQERENNKKEEFPANYLILYNTDEPDDGKEPLFTVGVFKQIGGYPLRGQEHLREVLKYFKQHNSKKDPNRIQLVNLDEINAKFKEGQN